LEFLKFKVFGEIASKFVRFSGGSEVRMLQEGLLSGADQADVLPHG
jgi:hypothetical protein